MIIILQNLLYVPHSLDTRYHAVKPYHNGASVRFICRRYKASKATLMRWSNTSRNTAILVIYLIDFTSTP